MKTYKFFLVCCLFGWMLKAQAYITYSNQRIDRALYDKHDPKTIVAGKIMHRHEIEVPKSEREDGLVVYMGPPGPIDIDFSISSVIMGDGKLMGQKINLKTLSFSWPEELVKLDTGVFCILILRDWNWKPDSVDLHIEVVIPSTGREILRASPPYLRIRDNKSAIDFLENELLLVLKEKLTNEKLRAVLMQIGPILKKGNSGQLEVFLENRNQWVYRAVLANLVFASQKDEYVKLLAKDIETYFSANEENIVLKDQEEFNGYSPFYLYYNYIFFLDPNDRTWGTRWDEEEENLNKQAILKLKATGLLSKLVCQKLKIDF